MSIDRLQRRILDLKNPTVVGLDPRPDYIPRFILDKYNGGQTLKDLADAYLEFNIGLIDALYEYVPAVKPQSAFYEALGPDGVRALVETAGYAKQRGMYVIMDAKRGDIGSTAEAYSDAYIGTTKLGDQLVAPFDCDSVTVNGYLGRDGIEPFLKSCRERDRSIFVLVKTSNPSSADLQDLIVDGEQLYVKVAKMIEELSADTVGDMGYSCAGAVVGATYPEELAKLRKQFPNTFFLVPGYGAQGGTAEDVRAAFDERGCGAIVNSSRGIITAWKKTGNDGVDYKEAALAEALRMKEALSICF